MYFDSHINILALSCEVAYTDIWNVMYILHIEGKKGRMILLTQLG